jgi:hypothetical protein
VGKFFGRAAVFVDINKRLQKLWELLSQEMLFSPAIRSLRSYGEEEKATKSSF